MVAVVIEIFSRYDINIYISPTITSNCYLCVAAGEREVGQELRPQLLVALHERVVDQLVQSARLLERQARLNRQIDIKIDM